MCIMSKRDKADRDWWRKVGELIGASLDAWWGRDNADFSNPSEETRVGASIAKVLLSQAAEVERLKRELEIWKDRANPPVFNNEKMGYDQ